MLPSELPDLPGFDIAAVNLASAQVSGDYYDFVKLSDGAAAIVISDVSGKGMPASLLASNLQASIRAVATTRANPGEILTVVNSTLFDSTDADRFATTFMISLHGNRVNYSNGGHNPPLLRRENGDVEWLEVGATPLGAFPGIEYPEGHVFMDPGDFLIMFTDGLTEATDANDEFFGEEGLERIAHECHDFDAESLLTRLHDDVMEFSGGDTGDDLTVIVLCRTHETIEPATT
jgi:sigma-B regulation protein RsbU (phosphoserine phosphatase)